MKSKLSKKLTKKLDPKDLSFIKTYGELHPINDLEAEKKFNAHVVVDDEEDDEKPYKFSKNGKRTHHSKREVEEETETNHEDDDDDEQNMIAPYQKLLNELSSESSSISKRKSDAKSIKTTKKLKNLGKDLKKSKEALNQEENDEDDVDENESDGEIEATGPIEAYAQEVLCKDTLDSEDAIKNDPFSLHFEVNRTEKQIEQLKSNLSDKQKLNELQQKLKFPSFGTLLYSGLLKETRTNLNVTNTDLKKMFIKQRLIDRLNECVEELIGVDDNEENDDEEANGIQKEEIKYSLDKRQVELLNIVSNYVDFYDPDVGIKFDSKNKFVYTLHALNHVLKTRSRIIAHNDKIKQNKDGESEYRDQGLTRPKVLILVPFRKFALKIVKIMIRLLMRKNEEYVSNKKRFMDAFGPAGDDDFDASVKKQKRDENEEEESKEATIKDEDFYFLFSGNTDDHFKMGLSVSKKSLKLFTEFYSSDIIIASPLGLRSVIDGDGEAKDYDFLSSIELLIVDNADMLLMQNWEHVSLIFEHLHLQPKKSHDVDYSRVRSWLLDGHAKFYRQTLVFSRIPAPSINSIFNRHCTNFNGKCQVDLLGGNLKYQTGAICRIGFQLGQVFHRLECDSPIDLPEARFQFFIDKILPKFRDEMMSHTLIFIPSYFDFVKIRNYFKKNDISSVNISEYSDEKTVNRSRYMFYHGKSHFMLVTERFHFYKRYKLRGINHIIFYELPNYAEFYSSFCNFLPDPKRFKNSALENFSSTTLYSKFDAQRLCAVVGHQRASHMINSDKSVHMFMTE